MRLHDLIPSLISTCPFCYNWVSVQMRIHNLRPSLLVGFILQDNTAAKANDEEKRKQDTPVLPFCCLFLLLCSRSVCVLNSSTLSVMLCGSGLKDGRNRKTKQKMDSFWPSLITNNSVSSAWLSNKFHINLLCGQWPNHLVITIN